MGGEWRSLSFEEALSIQRGHDLPESERHSGNIPIIGSAGLTGWHNESRAVGPGVTIGRSGASAGVISYVHDDYWPHNTSLFVTDFRGNDPRYCYYWLLTLGLERYAGGSAQPSLNRNHLSRIQVRLPPRSEQRQIANLLGALDNKIELNRRMAETLEAMARALFKSWFVDFDPVHARAERRLTGLPEDLAALFPDSFGDDGLPKGWQIQSLSKLGELDRATCSPSEFGAATVSHFSIPAFDVGRQPVLETASNIKSLKLRLTPPVVLFAKLNPGTPRIWPVASTTDRPALASTEYLAFRPVRDGMSFTYLALLLSSQPLVTRAASMVTGTSKSHQRVQAESLLATTWPAPPRSIVSRFDVVAEPLLSRADTARNQCETLAELRDTLLPKLISGELRIAGAEQCVAAA